MKKTGLITLSLLWFVINGNLIAQQTQSVYTNEFKRTPKNSVLTYLYSQPGFELYKNELRFLGVDSRILDFSFNGIDIRNPFNGEFAMSPIFEITDRVLIGKKSPGSVDVTSIQSNDRLSIFSAYLLDSFYPSTQSKGLQSFVAAASGRNDDFIPLSFQVAYKRRYHEQPTYQNEPVYEFVNPVNLSNLPAAYSEYNSAGQGQSKNKNISVSYPEYRLGSENTTHDYMAAIALNKDQFGLKYQMLGSYSEGRSFVSPSQIFAFDKRSAFQSKFITHEVSASYILTDDISIKGKVSSINYFRESYDPDFQNNVFLYGDPAANPNFIYDDQGYIRRKYSPYFIYGDFSLANENDVISNYSKNGYESNTVNIDVDWNFSEYLKLTPHFLYKSSLVRKVDYSPISLKSKLVQYQKSGLNPAYAEYSVNGSLGVNNYGYNLNGSEIDLPGFEPKKPSEYSFGLTSNFNTDLIQLNGTISSRSINLDVKNLAVVMSSDDYGYLTPESFIEKESENVINYEMDGNLQILDNLNLFGSYTHHNRIPAFDNMYHGIAFQSKLIDGSSPFLTQLPYADIKTITEKYYDFGFNYSLNETFNLSSTYFNISREDEPIIRQVNFVKNGFLSSAYMLVYSFDNEKEGLKTNFNYQANDYLRFYGNLTWFLDGTDLLRRGFKNIWESNSDAENDKNPLYYFYTYSAELNINKDHEFIDYPVRFRTVIEVRKHTGYPYTKITGYVAGPYPIEYINSPTTERYAFVDWSINVEFDSADFTGSVFLKIENLTNNRISHTVYGASGNADDDGYLSSQEGQAKIANYGIKYAEVYDQLNNKDNASFYFAPRTFILGVGLEF